MAAGEKKAPECCIFLAAIVFYQEISAINRIEPKYSIIVTVLLPENE